MIVVTSLNQSERLQRELFTLSVPLSCPQHVYSYTVSATTGLASFMTFTYKIYFFSINIFLHSTPNQWTYSGDVTSLLHFGI